MSSVLAPTHITCSPTTGRVLHLEQQLATQREAFDEATASAQDLVRERDELERDLTSAQKAVEAANAELQESRATLQATTRQLQVHTSVLSCCSCTNDSDAAYLSWLCTGCEAAG